MYAHDHTKPVTNCKIPISAHKESADLVVDQQKKYSSCETIISSKNKISFEISTMMFQKKKGQKVWAIRLTDGHPPHQIFTHRILTKSGLASQLFLSPHILNNLQESGLSYPVCEAGVFLCR